MKPRLRASVYWLKTVQLLYQRRVQRCASHSSCSKSTPYTAWSSPPTATSFSDGTCVRSTSERSIRDQDVSHTFYRPGWLTGLRGSSVIAHVQANAPGTLLGGLQSGHPSRAGWASRRHVVRTLIRWAHVWMAERRVRTLTLTLWAAGSVWREQAGWLFSPTLERWALLFFPFGNPKMF